METNIQDEKKVSWCSYIYRRRFPTENYIKLKLKKYGLYALFKKINDIAYVVGLVDNMRAFETCNAVNLLINYTP